jgi:chemotaxis response regulator CheB
MLQRSATSLIPPNTSPQVRRMVALGASAGGLHSLFTVFENLPDKIDCCIAVATHLSPTHSSFIPELLSRHTRLPVRRAENEPLRNSTIFVTPPRFHLIVEDDRFCLLDQPPLRFVKPNIDLLFESMARSFGQACVAVVLSGTGKDGAQGIRAVKAAGGITLVEDPTDAEFNDMPIAANRTGCVDFVLSLKGISEKLLEICSQAPPCRNHSS